MDQAALKETAQALVAPGKGVWANDASPATLDKRLEAVGIVPSEEARRDFREMLIKTEGLGEFISGIILHEDTLKGNTKDGIPFTELVKKQGIIIGIKVDKGTKDLANFPGEKVTEGLDGLRERLVEYKELGARFTKWRAVITIGDGIPTDVGIEANSEVFARYAALAQEADLVPIVEPEVLMEGSHGIERCKEVTARVLKSVFKKLVDHKVFLGGMLLKPNVVHPGKDSSEEVENEKVVEATLSTLHNTVPTEVPGVVFLSGGDAAGEMTAHLDLMNEKGPHPWELAFSFERALEGPAMEVWKGDDANIPAAQKELYKRAKLNSLARSGQYKAEMEKGENGG
ncbi:fructose-bisphosphate aldolase [Candidatus Woesebacteria bacterium RIFCSPLOWO2_01_FULL_43_11]|uniref:Probable fructose-bisphosphate aldolase class 1 n=1 Tax=Candidatus Woesebacteria bacterium RBG_16_42_24 TaxID=1802485 RepID=A0A1F7XL38_9BACT|nr:MAG: fructose-bisphosphate aldolase [Candidatus Woesebacteria bacterium RBG_16_42_24]OGM66750.1 MAG: fructose-bisphosphate aldolase [Candidatus Woesebacteria bacterium RIFCSPLOWO2_01_FULL_43_11]